jgi:hypothetical protein
MSHSRPQQQARQPARQSLPNAAQHKSKPAHGKKQMVQKLQSSHPYVEKLTPITRSNLTAARKVPLHFKLDER